MLARPALVVAIVLNVCALTARADSGSTADVYKCATIGTDAERLACYDAAVGRLKAAEDAGEVTTVSRTEIEQVKRESFGFAIPSLPSFAIRKSKAGEVEELKEVSEAVRSVSGSKGNLRISLTNGQVWVQIDDKGVRAKDPKQAVISQAALGSYKMKLDGGLAFKVRRER